MKSFVELYKPKGVNEIPQPVRELASLIARKEPVLLFGPPGTGKTSAVYAVAHEGDYEIIEFNASDVRNKDQVESIIESAALQQSLFMRKKIILVDEVDGLSGMEDRGGAGALVRVLEKARHAIVLVANDAQHEKLKDLKKKATLVEFPAVKASEIVKILQRICEQEGVVADELSLKKIAVNANGDIRAAVNDLQVCQKGKNIVVEGLATRESETEIAHALACILKTRSLNCSGVMENMSVDLDELALWLDENLPAEYTEADDLFNAYEKLAKADVFKGRIRRWQYWRLLVYQSVLLSGGISLAKKEPYRHFIKYRRTMRLLKIWQANMRLAKKKGIVEKLAPHLHTSKKEVLQRFGVYSKFLSENAMQELKFDMEEIAYVRDR